MDLKEFSIEGMSCAACALRIEKTMQEHSKVRTASVNFAARTLMVETELSDEAVLDIVRSLGYKAEAGASEASLAESEEKLIVAAKRELWLAAALSFPIFVLGMSGWHFFGSGLVQLVLCTAVLAGPGRKFFQTAYRLSRSLSANMDTLIVLGTSAAYLYSVWIVFSPGSSHYYFESAAVIITLILLGKYLEERARQGAARAVRALMALQPERALVTSFIPADLSTLNLSSFIETPVSQVLSGQLVLARTGDRIAVDGVVRAGVAQVDASMLTGESRPLDISVGCEISAGCLNLSGVLIIETVAVGRASALGRIIATVKHAIGTKAPIQRVADKVAAVFVPSVLSVAALTFFVWLLTGHQFIDALIPSISVLVVACPCALGLATPTSILVATGRAAKRGILIKDASSIELLHKCNVAVFDKTGTLTEGKPEVVTEKWSNVKEPVYRNLILAAVRALEASSSHPLAKAVVSYLQKYDLPSCLLSDVIEVAGVGISGKFDCEGRSFAVKIGKLPWAVDALTRVRFDLTSAASGVSLVPVAIDSDPVLIFEVRDILRGDSAAAISLLRENGVEPVMATGDREDVAAAVAGELNIRYFSQQSPQAKVDLVKSMQQSGHLVIMVGDGINDAPAIATADVGIAMGNGTDAAMATAGITLNEVSITKVAEAIDLSHATFKNIKQNLFWAFAYNVVLIPIAAVGGLTPMMAAGGMAFSSLFVVGNALRLRER